MTGQALKEAGMKQAAENRSELLAKARQIALEEAVKGTVTADDLPDDLRESLGPATGSVFKTPDFEFTGKRVTSVRASNHARELKVWKLTDAGRVRVQAIGRANRTPPIHPDPYQSPPLYPEPTPLPDWLR